MSSPGAAISTEVAPQLEKWLERNMCGDMLYMADHFDLRLDPRRYMPGAKSVVSLSYNYYLNRDQKLTVSAVVTDFQ